MKKRRLKILILAALTVLFSAFFASCKIEEWYEQQTCSHKYNEGVIELDATCANEGTKLYTCTKCGATKTEVINALPHTAIVLDGKAATCTEDGYTNYSVCAVCKTVIVEKAVIAALGHKETVVKGYAETCLDDGLTDGKKCSRCDVVLLHQQAIPCKGHYVENVSAVAATCTTAGHTAGTKCTKCDKVYSGCEPISMRAHEAFRDGVCLTCGKVVNYTYASELGKSVLATLDVTGTDGYFEQGYYRLVHLEGAAIGLDVVSSNLPKNVIDWGCDFGTGSGELVIWIYLARFNEETGQVEGEYLSKTLTDGYFKATTTAEYTDVYFYKDKITLTIEGVDVDFRITFNPSGTSISNVTRILKVS